MLKLHFLYTYALNCGLTNTNHSSGLTSTNHSFGLTSTNHSSGLTGTNLNDRFKIDLNRSLSTKATTSLKKSADHIEVLLKAAVITGHSPIDQSSDNTIILRGFVGYSQIPMFHGNS